MTTFTSGFTTPYYSYADASSATQAFADLKATGATSVIIDFPLVQASLTSSSVGYASGSTLQTLTTLIGLAKQAGLDVWVKPLVDVSDAHLQWHKITPADPNAWFQSYGQILVALGQTIQQAGASHFLLANELISMWDPVFNSQWTAAISQVRAVFSGQIGFNTPGPGANSGDVTHNSAFNFSLYNQVDFVGLDMYPVFNSATGSFTAAEVQTGWTLDAFGQNLTQALDNFFSHVHLPVYLTEFGNPAISGGNKTYYSIGANGGAPDPHGQAVFYNTSLDYILNHFSSTINGVFIYNWELNEGNPLTQTPGNVQYAWDVFGKPAQQVITAAYGGQQFMKPLDASFTGGLGNDQIYLYGSAIPIAGGTPVTQPQTFATTVSLTIDGTIINGQTPTVHFYVNGFDEGSHTLQSTPSSFIDAKGVTWSAPQKFTFTLNGLVNINELKVAIDSPVNVGGVENAQTFISSVSVDGVALTQGTYHPLEGSAQQLTITTGGQYDGGYEIIDASPWNSQLASRGVGTVPHPIQVSGGGGTDTVHVLGSPADYQIVHVSPNTLSLTENTGLGQNAVLNGISYIAFQNGAILPTGTQVTPASIQNDYLAITRVALPLDQATTLATSITAGTQTESQYVNSLLSQVANTTIPAVAIEGSMYGVVGTSAEITLLAAGFLPAQVENAVHNGFNPQVYASEALGLAFAFGNETGSHTFGNAFGPSNATMPNSAVGDAAYAVAALNAIFGSASTPNLAGVMQGFVANWKAFYAVSGIPGILNASADQVDLAARGAAWGDAVGVALDNNLGPLKGQASNFLMDAAEGIATYSMSLVGQPAHHPFPGEM